MVTGCSHQKYDSNSVIIYYLQYYQKDLSIQKDLRPSNTPSTVAEISKKFTREIHKRNVTNAMKLLTDNMQNEILPLNQKTLHQLKQKHPQGKGAELDVLLTDTPKQGHPIKFDTIDTDLVKRAAVRTRGGAGSSGLDADE